MSAATWRGPSSFSTSFIAAKIGRSGTTRAEAGRARRHDFGQRLDLRVGEDGRRIGRRRPVAEQRRGERSEKAANARRHHRGRIVAGRAETRLAGDPGLDVAPAKHRVERLLDKFGLALLDHQHRALAARRNAATSSSTSG